MYISANALVMNHDGRTPLDIARAKRCSKVVCAIEVFSLFWECEVAVILCSLFSHFQLSFVLWLFSIQCWLEPYLLVLWLAARTFWSCLFPTALKKSVSMMSLIWSYFMKENRRILAWVPYFCDNESHQSYTLTFTHFLPANSTYGKNLMSYDWQPT